MKIDGNELMKNEPAISRAGDIKESWRIKQEFLKQVRENGDHCSCTEACPHHGNCFECVTLHRGHQDHLPFCMWEIVNKKIAEISWLTEDSYFKDKEKCECSECNCDCSKE